MTIYLIALKLFLVANPIGNAPTILALVKDFPPERQERILLRETLFAFLLAVFFQFIGGAFLSVLGVENYSLRLCGGVLLFLVGLTMAFPEREQLQTGVLRQEPYIVPIATPLLSGAGLMSIIMTFSAEVENHLTMFLAISLAWVGVTAVMASAPFLLRLFGRQGMLALEKLMGLVLVMISVEMILRGLDDFIQSL